MFGVLWFLVWITVSGAFYGDSDWYVSDDEDADHISLNPQINARNQFSDNLRRFAKSYHVHGDGDDEMTLMKAKLRLRRLQVFNYTGSPYDFDKSYGMKLPLLEGAQYCTMGTHTKVECNYCTCVAGQLYMCTGKICPAQAERLQDLSTCIEGKTRQIDSCNYCYCRNGREFCSTRDCRLNHGRSTLRRPKCVEGVESIVKCNRCLCQKGLEYCTMRACLKKLRRPESVLEIIEYYKRPRHRKPKIDKKQETEHSCVVGTERKIYLYYVCYCRNGQWYCENKDCESTNINAICKIGSKKRRPCYRCICTRNGWKCQRRKECETTAPLLDVSLRSTPECTLGRRQRLDACNYCWCSFDRKWLCSNHTCDSIFHGSLRSQWLPPRTKSCAKFDVKVVKCNICECHGNRWFCTKRQCTKPNLVSDLETDDENNYMYLQMCQIGDERLIDCNKCLCRFGQWYCQIKDCGSDKTSDLHLKFVADNVDTMDVRDIEYGESYNNDLRRPRPFPAKPLRSDEISCKEESVRAIDDCNYCICYNGMELCTQIPCWNNKPSNIYSTEPEPRCVSGEPLPPPDQCNICICLNSDILCTVNSCSLREAAGNFLNIPRCVSGMKRNLDSCNVCYCRKGLWFCQNKECKDPDKIPISNDKNNEMDIPKEKRLCLDGKKRRNKCYNCVCLLGKWKCKRLSTKGCRDDSNTYLRLANNKCTPGENYILDSCNTCFCNEKRVLMCTRLPCRSHKMENNIVLSSKCKVGKKKKFPCIRCTCFADGWRCKMKKKCRKDSITGKPYLRQLDGECTPGKDYIIDSCNTCYCTGTRVLMCTRLACRKGKTENYLRSESGCVDGQKYELEDGCNYCICHGGQEFCTSRACLGAGTVPEKFSDMHTCLEGDIEDAGDDCNVCICLQGKFTCTNINCSDMGRKGGKHSSSLRRRRKRKKPRHRAIKSNPIHNCISGIKYGINDTECQYQCICDKHELLCTKLKCNESHTETLLSEKDQYKPTMRNDLTWNLCIENEPLPSLDPCNACICLRGVKACTIIPCSYGDEIITGFEELPGLYYKSKTSKGIKGNMGTKKKGIFCNPFTFFSPVNNKFCRNCFCLHNGLALCLLNLCKYSKDIPHNNSPEDLKNVCKPGEIGYPTKCVTCSCSDEGQWICIREDVKFCQERDCDAKDEFHMGFYPYCAGCKCSIKEWFCSIENEPCEDFSNVSCPIGTFIHNPNQDCSLCLCGGGGSEVDASNMCFTEAKCVRQVNRSPYE